MPIGSKTARKSTNRRAAKPRSEAAPRVTRRRPAVGRGSTPKKRGKSGSEAAAGMSDEAVRNATGKGWDEWFTLLDAHGAKRLPHKDIAALLADTLGVKPWWSQMVAVAYERSRGLRDKHQRPDGFSVSASRTIGASAKAVFDAWTNPKSVARWLPGTKIVAHKATPHRSVRVTWTDGGKSVSVGILTKPGGRAQVTVQHDKLPRAADVEKMRSFWKAALESLDGMLA